MEPINKAQYFLAIVPGDPVFTHVQELKKFVGERFDDSYAPTVPPHIPLYPGFEWDETEEYILVDNLKRFVASAYSTDVQLNGFDCSSTNKSIMIRQEENPALLLMQKDLSDFLFRYLKLKQEENPNAPDALNSIEITANVLSDKNFRAAWKTLHNKHYHASFTANQVALLKCSNNQWNAVANFDMD